MTMASGYVPTELDLLRVENERLKRPVASRRSRCSTGSRRGRAPRPEARLREIIAEMRDWKTAGMGGQTAMQLDKWVADLHALTRMEEK